MRTQKRSGGTSSRTRSIPGTGPRACGRTAPRTGSRPVRCSSSDRGAEAELCNELRLAELWGFCESGSLAMDEFFELSALITEVEGIRGSLCADCEMLGRPNVERELGPGHHHAVPGASPLPVGPRPDRRGHQPPVGNPRPHLEPGRMGP